MNKNLVFLKAKIIKICPFGAKENINLYILFTFVYLNECLC